MEPKDKSKKTGMTVSTRYAQCKKHLAIANQDLSEHRLTLEAYRDENERLKGALKKICQGGMYYCELCASYDCDCHVRDICTEALSTPQSPLTPRTGDKADNVPKPE